jgi:hypothetical protein
MNKLLTPEICELCGRIVHPLWNNGNCQDIAHCAPDEDIEIEDMHENDGIEDGRR